MGNEEIFSLQNARVKRAAKLRDARQRSKQQRFLIDGARELLLAIGAGIELDEVFVCPALCRSQECTQVLEQLNASLVEVVYVSPGVMEKLSFGGRSEGVLGVATARPRTLDQLVLPDNPLIAVLEGIEKPGNVGAVLRSADAAGVDALIVADGGTDLYNPNAIRASLGTIFTLPVCVATTQQTIAWLIQQRLRIFAAQVNARRLYTDVDFRGSAAIVLGSESSGLSGDWLQPEITGVKLPMCGVADSLNVSAAAAVLFYEARRQRGGV